MSDSTGKAGPNATLRRLNKALPRGLTVWLLEEARGFGLLQKPEERALNHPKTILEDDTFLVSYPRSGITWLRFMLTGLLWHREVSFNTVRRVIPGIHTRTDEELQYAPYPRLLKSHAPGNPRYPRVVYLVRDGRDVAVSLYYLRTRRGAAYDNFSSFLRKFLAGQTGSMGSWAGHVHSWLALAETRPFLMISYEALQADAHGTLSQIADFLSVSYSPQDLERAVAAGAFSRMRAQESAVYQRSAADPSSQFEVRKGVSGDWRNHFSETDHDLFWDEAGEAMRAAGYTR